MKKLRFILILTVCLLSAGAFGQPAETIYQGDVIINKDDETVNSLHNYNDGPFPIRFDFYFYGIKYTTFYASENGRIMFTDPLTSSYNTETNIPSAALPNNFIAAFWDNLQIPVEGDILYKTIGTEPNRKLIVQFKNHIFYNPPTYMGTFAIILYEGTNVIQTQFRQIVNNSSDAAHGSSAVLGIENVDGTAGVEYAYHSNSAAQTGKVITYTPDGSGGYTVNTDSPYNFVYLSTNSAAPEPGIPTLLTPPQDGVIGTQYTFTWSDAGNVSNYQLQISESADLGAATTYNLPGTTLSQYVTTGLIAGSTYYWGVFANNSTGTTWCEIKKFSVSAAPPLAAVPQTLWVEQTQEKVIALAYTGGDASPKTALITSLPAQGKLYQYNAGVKGAEITGTLPITVTDAGRNVIYAASGGTGNGAGNFKYKMNDAGGDSPEAQITINVSPPGIPNVLYVAKGSNYVEVQFDIPMSDPSGKESQFTVKSNGTPATISSATFKTGDNNTYILNTSALTEPVLVSYTQGTITSAPGGVLLSFPDQPVTLTAQTITFSQSLDLKYNQSPFTLAATASSNLGVTYSSSILSVATISGSTATFLATGSSDITARQAGDATYAPAKFVKTLNISKGDQVITFTLPSKTYGAADFTLSATTTSGLPITYSSDNTAVATVTGNLVHIVSAGTAVITASQAGNTLWNSATNPQTLTVSKATLTVTADPKSRAYGAANPPLTFTYSGWVAGVETIDTPPAASTTVTLTSPAAVYTGAITATGGSDNNYLFSFVPADFTVTKATLTVTADPKSKVYNEANPPLTFTYSGWVAGVETIDTPPTASTTVTLTSPAAVYTGAITVAGGVDNNYSFAYVAADFTVTKATLTVTAEAKNKAYGAANPPLTFTYSGWVAGVETIDTPPAASTTVTIASPPAVYTGAITVTGGLDNNYLFSFVPADFTVIKADQTITFPAFGTVLNGAADFSPGATSNSGLTVSYSSGNSLVATIVSGLIHITGVGSSVITATQAGDANYNAATPVLQTLTVSPSVGIEIVPGGKDNYRLWYSNENLFVNCPDELPASVGRLVVYDMQGKVVLDKSDISLAPGETIKTSLKLPKGIYVAKLKTGRQESSMRVVVM